jgi:RND family efflux transporter MFP subunit
VEQIHVQLQQRIVYSPIAGLITRYEATVGELAVAHTPLVTIISDSLAIEAFVPEVDSAKVSLGDEAVFTLDAYGSDAEFQARVAAVDPAETVIDGVSSYKTTMELVEPDTRIKSGMTANIEIFTDRRESVIAIPQRAVVAKEGKKFVRVIQRDKSGKSTFKEAAVVTGLQGSDGRVEIISGLREGDEVALYVEESRKSRKP